MILVDPSMKWQMAFLEMAEEYVGAGDSRYQAAIVDFDSYLQLLTDFARGEKLPPDRVRETTFWGVDGGQLIGAVRLRHSLTPALSQMGGHVGYDVRPSKRGIGLGTAMLAGTLDRAQDIGLNRVLITCDIDNKASVRVIEKNGGRLFNRVQVDGYDKLVARYWIDL